MNDFQLNGKQRDDIQCDKGNSEVQTGRQKMCA